MSQATLDILSALPQSGQPLATYSAVENEIKQRVGFKLLTMLVVDGEEVFRVHTNWPDVQPVGGRKKMGPTPWGDLVIRQRQPFVGADKAALRWAFYDAEQIESWGLGSVINIPIIYDGETLGSINILDVENYYRDEHVALLTPLAPLLIPAFLDERRRTA